MDKELASPWCLWITKCGIRIQFWLAIKPILFYSISHILLLLVWTIKRSMSWPGRYIGLFITLSSLGQISNDIKPQLCVMQLECVVSTPVVIFTAALPIQISVKSGAGASNHHIKMPWRIQKKCHQYCSKPTLVSDVYIGGKLSYTLYPTEERNRGNTGKQVGEGKAAHSPSAKDTDTHEEQTQLNKLIIPKI